MNIIVSGASQGIGFELAIQFAKKGHKVIAIARNKDRLKELETYNPNIKGLGIDLLDHALSIEIQNIYKKGGVIDVLINNAGQLINKSFTETSLVEFESQYKSNVLTAINLSKACLPFINRGGHIVNITSMGGYQGSSKFPGLSAYSSAKGALSILSECMAEELKEQAINVNALALGAVQTDMLKTAFPDYTAPLSASQMASYIVEFALSGKNYYNGKVLPVALGNP